MSDKYWQSSLKIIVIKYCIYKVYKKDVLVYQIVREYEKLEDFREYRKWKRIKILENKLVANSAPADQKKPKKSRSGRVRDGT